MWASRPLGTRTVPLSPLATNAPPSGWPSTFSKLKTLFLLSFIEKAILKRGDRWKYQVGSGSQKKSEVKRTHSFEKVICKVFPCFARCSLRQTQTSVFLAFSKMTSKVLKLTKKKSSNQSDPQKFKISQMGEERDEIEMSEDLKERSM